MILIGLFFIIAIIAYRLNRYFRDENLGWKAKNENHKYITYKEKINGKWDQIYIDARINIGTFEPVFKSKIDWLDYPA